MRPGRAHRRTSLQEVTGIDGRDGRGHPYTQPSATPQTLAGLPLPAISHRAAPWPMVCHQTEGPRKP